MNTGTQSLIGRKLRIIENVDDHTGYKGQELEVIKELEDDYIIVTDGNNEWQAGIEETNLFA